MQVGNFRTVKTFYEFSLSEAAAAPNFKNNEFYVSFLQQECDLGQQSILHAVKARPRKLKHDKRDLEERVIEESTDEGSSSKPFSQTLVDLQLENDDRENISDERKPPARNPISHLFNVSKTCPFQKSNVPKRISSSIAHNATNCVRGS